MVHFTLRKKKKINLGMIDKISELIGWKTIISKPNERIYAMGNREVKFKKIETGYKTFMIKDKKVVSFDINERLETALSFLGETLMFGEW